MSDRPEYPKGELGGKLPAPRLELRWEKEREGLWWCKYLLVLPVDHLDCRSNVDDGERNTEWVSLIGLTKCSSERAPVRPDGTIETPFRDGVHILRDQNKLCGVLPAYATYGDASMLLERDRAL